jgi:hypothetical protein
VQISEKGDGDPCSDYTSVQGRKHEPYTESPNLPRLKKARKVKSKVMSMLIVFFHIKRILHKEFVLAGQTVNSAITVMFYGDCMKMWEDFTPNCGNRRTGCCMTTMHHLTLLFFHQGFLTKTA